MNLEDDLKRALRRERPVPGFSSRVLSRIGNGDIPQGMTRRRPRWHAVAASLTLTAILGGWGAHAIHERRQEEGERARQQVLVALQIAGEKVRYAQHEVRAIGSPR